MGSIDILFFKYLIVFLDLSKNGTAYIYIVIYIWMCIYILIYYTEMAQYNLRDQLSEQVLDDCLPWVDASRMAQSSP